MTGVHSANWAVYRALCIASRVFCALFSVSRITSIAARSAPGVSRIASSVARSLHPALPSKTIATGSKPLTRLR